MTDAKKKNKKITFSPSKVIISSIFRSYAFLSLSLSCCIILGKACYFPETNASRRYTKWLLQTAPASWLERSIYSALQWFLQKMHRVLKGDENYRGRSDISIFNPFRKCHDAP